MGCCAVCQCLDGGDVLPAVATPSTPREQLSVVKISNRVVSFLLLFLKYYPHAICSVDGCTDALEHYTTACAQEYLSGHHPQETRLSQLRTSIHNNTTVPLSCRLRALLRNLHSFLDDQVLSSSFLCICTCLPEIHVPLAMMLCLTKAAGRVEQILEEKNQTNKNVIFKQKEISETFIWWFCLHIFLWVF